MIRTVCRTMTLQEAGGIAMNISGLAAQGPLPFQGNEALRMDDED